MDDSTFVRRSLTRLFEVDPRVDIVGAAASGEEFLERRECWKPEVVLLDLHRERVSLEDMFRRLTRNEGDKNV